MFSTGPDARQAFITGLRDLADYLDVNPGVPVPRYGTTIHLIAALAEEGGIAQIETLAALFEAPVTTCPESLDRFNTHCQFGPITYEAVSHTATSMAVYRALQSYHGCVSPDE